MTEFDAMKFCDIKLDDHVNVKLENEQENNDGDAMNVNADKSAPRYVNEEKIHMCHICSEVFQKKYKLQLHLARLHDLRNNCYQCEDCRKFFLAEINFLKHQKMCRKFSCPFCGKEFGSKSKLVSHVKTHTKEKSHACDECGKTFSTKYGLKSHIEIVHRGSVSFQCHICLKKFSRVNSLKAHHLIHTGEKPFNCRMCESDFREKAQLMKHLQLKHSVTDDEMSVYVKIMPKKVVVESEKVEQVIKSTMSMSRIRLEKRLVPETTENIIKEEEIEEEKPIIHDFACSQCEKTFKTQKHLATHVHAVHIHRPSICDLCQQVFKNPNYLRNHKNRFHNTEIAICDICNKICKSKSVLYNHKKDVHEEIEGLYCKLCKEPQKNKSYLSRHKRRFCIYRNRNKATETVSSSNTP